MNTGETTARRTIVFAIVAIVLCVGCCGGGAKSARSGSRATFADGVFNDVLVYPGATPAGGRTSSNGVTAQSYFVHGVTPEQVLDFYRKELSPRWASTEAPRPEGSAGWRGTWTRAGHQLEVSATHAPTAKGDTTQLSLLLRRL